jgi:hypothetical protein
MFCAGCGTQGPVVGKFCIHCDHRARTGSFDRRRPVGGSQWQALWGIDYADGADRSRRHRRLQVMAAVAACLIAAFIVLSSL